MRSLLQPPMEQSCKKSQKLRSRRQILGSTRKWSALKGRKMEGMQITPCFSEQQTV